MISSRFSSSISRNFFSWIFVMGVALDPAHRPGRNGPDKLGPRDPFVNGLLTSQFRCPSSESPALSIGADSVHDGVGELLAIVGGVEAGFFDRARDEGRF